MQSTARVKAGSLWPKGKEDLKKQLDELKLELGHIRTQKIAGGAASKLTKMYVPSMGIALLCSNTDAHTPSQPRLKKIHRACSHSHQRQPTPSTTNLLQEQEISTARFASQADKGYPKTANCEGSQQENTSAEEEADTFPNAEVRCQGAWTENRWVGCCIPESDGFLNP